MIKPAFVFLAFLLLATNAAHGFQSQKQGHLARLVSLSAWRAGGDSSSIPQNTTATTTTTTKTKKKKVYVNQDYVPPITVAPIRVSAGKPVSPTISSLKGGHYFVEIGHCLEQSATNNNNKLLREAGSALHEVGMSWQAGDWEAVTYSALDASQTMKLAAVSLNRRHETNEFQQALAGVAVELLELSNSQQPRAISLQGLSLRLYQASRSAADAMTAQHLEQASRAAQSLAKLHGANASYLPRRFQLWWHERKQQKYYDSEGAFE